MKTAKFYIDELERILPDCRLTENQRKEIRFWINTNKAALSIASKNYQEAFPIIKEAERYAVTPEQKMAVLSDRGLVYVLLGDNSFAEKYFKEIEETPSSHYLRSVALFNYLFFLYLNDRFDDAQRVLCIVKQLVDRQGIRHLQSEILRVEADMLFKSGNYRDAFNIMKRATEINDSILSTDNIRQIMSLANQNERYKLLDISKKTNAENRSKTIWVIVISILLFFSVVLIFLIIHNGSKKSRLICELSDKIKSDSAASDICIRKYESTLDDKCRELNEYMIGMGRTEKTLSEISSIINDPLSDVGHRLEHVASILQREGVSPKEGDGINSCSFNSVYSRVNFRLAKLYPSLTKSEIAMCVYILMGMSNKEIASSRNTSVRTVENTKYRMYKKLGVPEDMPVRDYLISRL